MKKVSVVILNWNGEQMLRQFLPTVVSCSAGEEVEVCVADNASTDASVQWLRNEFPAVRLIVLDRNYGFAEGYNRALEQVDAEYVVLLNSDVEVTPHWLEPLVTFMDAHPEVAACQPKLLDQRKKSFFEYAGAAGGYLDKYGYPFCRGRIFDVIEEEDGQYETSVPVFWVSGAAMFIRLKDYREVGGLDNRFFAHMEEIDLCWRLKSRGKELMYIPQSRVFHVGGATLNKDNPRKTFLNFRNNLLMLYKNLPEAELTSVMCVRGWLDRLAACVFFLKGERGNARAVFQARKEFKQLRASYQQQRKENLEKSVVTSIPERSPFSILWKFHIGRKKRFSQLKF
ncbi:MAG: glycosyltransferase family 2 protein [Bacteroides sp.]|nr:glycosyltransferase family 2 protein [Bacteroidaceae bacterium]MBQ8874958.1 glycosyltransferase family 2 protein [Bacteroides sp.]